MIISLSHWHPSYTSLPPGTIVHTLRHTDGPDSPFADLGPTLCDVAWTDPAEAEGHFWVAQNAWVPRDAPESEQPTVERVAMTLAEFMRANRELASMNPIEFLARIDWQDRYRAAFPGEKEVA